MAAMWSKLLIMIGAFDGGHWLTAAALIASSLLGLVYLLPIGFRALFPPVGDAPARDFVRPGGTSGTAVVAVCIAAAASIVLFFLVDPSSVMAASTP
jgi:formate hydrogenlyase subunit 3/multisubunit Na+/H+ antiporter MnhD subunit